MSRRTSPPFRADHVGSLLRPPRLRDARADFAAGSITAAELRTIEDEEIVKAIRMQEEVGLQSATDGEFRRATWHMDFIYALGGVSKAAGNLAIKFTNPSGTIEWTPAAIEIDGRVRIDETIFGEDFAFLKSHVSTAVPKQTIPSPNMVHYRGGPAMLDPRVYPDIEEFWADLAAAYADEVRRLGDLGPARRDQRARRGRRAPAPALHQPDQRGGPGQARRHGDHHAHVPRQLPVLLGRLGRVRLRGRGAVLRA
jgi:5-methyltetrahydropteroyltriglutamate--homocysteine methyltransferase